MRSELQGQSALICGEFLIYYAMLKGISIIDFLWL